ncbi:MAG: uracil-DNA glycosylase [Candidatus Paceibacterota bacterium]
MDKTKKLKKIHAKWIKKCECTLRHTATQAVPGHGNPKAHIVFIGEAPGKSEDETGKPFVGVAGKFLDEMLTKTNLKRDNVYITSIVKYRPPGNRDPNPDEKASCREWLLEELTLIAPKMIVFLGRHAMNSFFPNLKISKAHGKLLIEPVEEIPTKYFYPLYHPAAALYNSSMRKTLIVDFKKIPQILKEIKKHNSSV